MKTYPIDNGFNIISAADAKRLANNQLPAIGREKLVVDKEGNHYWLRRLNYMGKSVWSIRSAGSWKLVGGTAQLG